MRNTICSGSFGWHTTASALPKIGVLPIGQQKSGLFKPFRPITLGLFRGSQVVKFGNCRAIFCLHLNVRNQPNYTHMSRESLMLAVIDQAVRDYLREDKVYFGSAKRFIEERNLWEYVESKKKKPILQRHVLVIRTPNGIEIRLHCQTFGEFKKAVKTLEQDGFREFYKEPVEGFWYSSSEKAKDELRRIR